MKETQEKFYKIYDIPKVSNYRQYNYAQVPRGLEELQKSLDAGIECKWINRTPTPDNDCVYWTEMYYPDIKDSKLIELLCLASRYDEITLYACDRDKLCIKVLQWFINNYSEELKKKVQEIYE